MKKISFALLVLIFLGAGYLVLRPDNKPAVTESVNSDVPVAASTTEVPTLTEYKFKYGNLSFKYPDTWNLVAGEANTDESQIVTIESPKDTNNFYYCIDFNEFSAGKSESVDFTVKDTKVSTAADFEASGIGKSLKLVTYATPSNALVTALSDDTTVTTGSTTFTQSITNPTGRSLQVFGRFNCREDSLPVLGLEDYSKSQNYQDGLQALLNISY